MKKFTKILSSVLASSMLMSVLAINSFAASTAHNVTIAPSKTEALEAGETITVELMIDNTEKLTAMEYVLSYDTDVFEIDMVQEAYVDLDWFDDIVKTNSRNPLFGDYLGSPIYTPCWDFGSDTLAGAGVEGEINFKWAGAKGGVPANKAETDKAIGVFYFTVKDDAANGKATFSLTGLTGDGGENSTADMVCAPVTVTVGEDAPVVPDEPKTKTLGYEADLAYDGVSTGFQFVAERTDADVTVESDVVTLPSVENLGNVKLGLNIENIPADKAFDDIKAVLNVFARWVK